MPYIPRHQRPYQRYTIRVQLRHVRSHHATSHSRTRHQECTTFNQFHDYQQPYNRQLHGQASQQGLPRLTQQVPKDQEQPTIQGTKCSQQKVRRSQHKDQEQAIQGSFRLQYNRPPITRQYRHQQQAHTNVDRLQE